MEAVPTNMTIKLINRRGQAITVFSDWAAANMASLDCTPLVIRVMLFPLLVVYSSKVSLIWRASQLVSPVLRQLNFPAKLRSKGRGLEGWPGRSFTGDASHCGRVFGSSL